MPSSELERAERAIAAIRDQIGSSPLMSQRQDTLMQSSHLERAERAVAAIRDQRELPPDIVEALEEIVNAIGSVDRRLATLAPTGIHLADDLGDPAKEILALLGER